MNITQAQKEIPPPLWMSAVSVSSRQLSIPTISRINITTIIKE
jgi:hypothetical protein